MTGEGAYHAMPRWGYTLGVHAVTGTDRGVFITSHWSHHTTPPTILQQPPPVANGVFIIVWPVGKRDLLTGHGIEMLQPANHWMACAGTEQEGDNDDDSLACCQRVRVRLIPVLVACMERCVQAHMAWYDMAAAPLTSSPGAMSRDAMSTRCGSEDASPLAPFITPRLAG
jgi:hypothetical protein